MPNFVSLVMTVYNCERFIALAIDSVIDQNYPYWELIIWDDGSTDESPDIAANYAAKDSRIQFVKAPHLGRTPALKSALALTQHVYIGWLDSDDLLLPDALAATVKTLDAKPHVGMVYTDHTIVNEAGDYLRLGARCSIPYSPTRLLIDFMTFHFRLIRREIYTLVGGIDLEFKRVEDYDFCLKVSEVTTIHHLQQSLYLYRCHQAMRSERDKLEQQQYCVLAITNALNRRGLKDSYRLSISNGRYRIEVNN
jgi:glycosyltransferase involved in cell wall biosynthesis